MTIKEDLFNSPSKTIRTFSLAILFWGLIGYIIYINVLLKNEITKTYEIKVIPYLLIKKDTLGTKNALSSLQDSIRALNYELDIAKKELEKIDEVNNKRFDLLGWGLSLIITIIVIFFALNYTISKSTVRDVVYEEMDDKYKDYKKRYDQLIKDIETYNEMLKTKINSINQ